MIPLRGMITLGIVGLLSTAGGPGSVSQMAQWPPHACDYAETPPPPLPVSRPVSSVILYSSDVDFDLQTQKPQIERVIVNRDHVSHSLVWTGGRLSVDNLPPDYEAVLCTSGFDGYLTDHDGKITVDNASRRAIRAVVYTGQLEPAYNRPPDFVRQFRVGYKLQPPEGSPSVSVEVRVTVSPADAGGSVPMGYEIRNLGTDSVVVSGTLQALVASGEAIAIAPGKSLTAEILSTDAPVVIPTLIVVSKPQGRERIGTLLPDLPVSTAWRRTDGRFQAR